MYYDFFGLDQPPFRITPDPGFFFDGGNRGAILEALRYAIGKGEGVVKVTGEVGSGKTMLCRMLQSQLPDSIEGVYIANPSVPPEEVLRAICAELQLALPPEAGRLAAQQRLASYLVDQHAAGRQVVVFVEESQSMPVATLEEIRLLSNLETGRHKLLQIVLFGQPELDALLRRPDLRQLRERITHGFSLAPLSPREIGEYLAFRLRAAGYRGPDLFGPRLVRLIARASEGLTRRVNLIADKALLAAFAEGTHTLAPRHVKAAIRDSEFAAEGWPARRRWSWVAVAGVAALVGGASVYGWIEVRRAPLPAPGPAVASAPPAAASDPVPRRADGLLPPQDAAPAVQPAIPAPPTREAADAAPTDAAPGPPSLATPDPAAARPAVAWAADPPAGARPDPGAAASLLERRLAAGERWLREAPPETIAIQVLGAPGRDEIERRLAQLARSVDVDRLFVFRTVARDRPSLTIVYGGFADRAAARAAIDQLPAPIRANNPLLRTVRGLRDELAAAPG